MLQIPNFVVYYCWTFVQIVQSSSIVAEFSTKNNFGIQNLAIQDEKTIFLGTTNYLYKLESENLHILDFIQTGPVMDSPYCNFNGDCTNWNNKKTVNKSMIDNYNKILLLIKAKNRTLISCGSVKQGVCNFYTSSDFRELDEISPKIAVASNAKNASTVAFLDLENFETLFVGASYTLEPYRHEFPAVASRTLASRSLQLRNQNAVGQSAMILRTENRWDFKIDYIFGFYAQKFAYWALVQKESLSHGAPMVSKLARICSQDQDYSSYSEIILECLDQQNFKFNILKSAFFGQISGKFYLFGIFEKFSKSALCIFPLKDIDSSFKLNIERCLNGIDYSNLPHFGLNRKCQKFAGNRRDNSSCNKINVGGSLPLTKVTSLTATAAILTSVTAYGETLFVGTNNGQILKLRLKNVNEAQQYGSIKLNSTNNISITNLQMDPSGRYLYAVAYNKLFKVKTENCDKYQNCETCSSSGDPFCGWCTLKNKCSTKESCQNDENFVQDSSKCVKILSLTPKLAPVEMDLLEISIHFNHLPLLAPNQKFRCQLGFDEKPSFIEDAIIAEKNILRCTKKAYKRQNWTNNGNVQTILPLKVKIDDHYVLKESNFTFFDCSSFGLCTGCISTEFPCNWCISDNKCRYKNEKCDHDEQVRILQLQYAHSNNALFVTHDHQNHHDVNDHQNLNVFTTKYSNPAWQCPRMEVDRSIMVTDSFPVSIRMNVLNMEKLTNMDLDKLFCVTTIESKDIVVDAILSHDKRNVSCEEYTYFYTSKKPTVVANLTLKTVAGLSIDQMHVTVYKCEMMADDCTQCLAVDPIFRCGWCDNKCRYGASCTSAPALTCPAPTVLGFEPKSGPVQGGTLIQIEGRDLRSQDRVWIGGIPCHVTGYHSSGGLSCLTGHSDEPSSAPLKVERSPQVSGHSKEYFHFIEPALEAFQPNVGPKSGGTKVVLSGRHLTSATNVSASFGNLPCRIDRVISSPSALVCYTSPANGSFEQYDTLLLRLDNANLTLKVPFTYMPDPVVITINPLAALQSGGRKISIIGQSFQSIQKPLMYLLDEQGRTASESSICQVVNSTLMLCPSPSLIPRIVENPKVKRQIEIDHSQLQKYKNYGVGFKMDDVTGINDLGSIFRFTITPDPVVDHFKGDKISRPSDPLVLEGRHLRIGSSPDDYAITIGDQPCNISYLADSQLICQPTMVDSTGETDPDDMTSTAQRIVIVKIGNTIYRPGILTYNSLIATGLRNSMLEVSGPEGQSRPVQVVQGVDGALVGCILGACSAFVLILLATFGVWWKRKNWAVERDYRRIQLQMDMLESNVRQECKQAFAELQTDMSDLTGDLVPLNIPYWPLDRYAVKILFREDQRNALQILDHRYHNNGYSNPLTTSFKHFDSLLGNQNFVSTLIECLEKQNSINSYDKSYIGSLLTIILAQNMEYFTDILFSLLKKLIAKTVQEKNPQLMLRRSDTIVEKLLTNWMAICCYDYLQQTPGQSLFLLFKALKHQIEKGPVDAVTSEARYTLSEESLLKQAVDAEPVLLRVVPPNNDYAGGQTILCRVLNCDTIGQVKSKILDTLYRNLAFTMRPSVNDIDLEWRGNGSIQSITLTDKPDTSTPPCPGTPTKQSSSSHLTIQRLNTVASYRLPDHAVIYVLPKIRDCPVYTSSGDSTHTYASINSSTLLLSKTNRQMVTFNSILAQNRDLVVESRNNSLDSSTSSSGIGTAATNPSLRNSWQSTNGGSSRKAGKKHSTLNSRTSASASNGRTMTKFWHLVKPDEAKEPGAIRHGSIPEIYLTRLLATKGTVQHFIDDFVLCALNVGPDFPPAVKYLFDFFHSEASRHNLSDISIINSWKTNSIALRFWVNTIKNPDFVFDVEKTAALDSCLSVVAQTFMDACSSGGGANGPFSNQYQNSQKLNKDSPSSKLLFARDVGKYQQNFRHYYCDVQNKVQTVSDEKLKLIMRSLSENFANLGVDSAIHELLAYVSRYREQIFDALNSDQQSQAHHLPHRLDQILNFLNYS